MFLLVKLQISTTVRRTLVETEERALMESTHIDVSAAMDGKAHFVTLVSIFIANVFQIP